MGIGIDGSLDIRIARVVGFVGDYGFNVDRPFVMAIRFAVIVEPDPTASKILN